MTRVAVGAERSRMNKQLDEAGKEQKEKEEAMAKESKAAEERWNQERCGQGEFSVPSQLVRCSRRQLAQPALSTVAYRHRGSNHCSL